MLLYNNTQSDKKIYNRCDYINLRFKSFRNRKFNNSCFTYSCDQQFFKFLYETCHNKTISEEEVSTYKQYVFFVEQLPKRIQEYLCISDDIVTAFKAYLNLNDLDCIIKDINHV